MGIVRRGALPGEARKKLVGRRAGVPSNLRHHERD